MWAKGTAIARLRVPTCSEAGRKSLARLWNGGNRKIPRGPGPVPLPQPLVLVLPTARGTSRLSAVGHGTWPSRRRTSVWRFNGSGLPRASSRLGSRANLRHLANRKSTFRMASSSPCGPEDEKVRCAYCGQPFTGLPTLPSTECEIAEPPASGGGFDQGGAGGVTRRPSAMPSPSSDRKFSGRQDAIARAFTLPLVAPSGWAYPRNTTQTWRAP
jgi:hypothetical protein